MGVSNPYSVFSTVSKNVRGKFGALNGTEHFTERTHMYTNVDFYIIQIFVDLPKCLRYEEAKSMQIKLL